jgi:trehalose 6-phosphate phosphatase
MRDTVRALAQRCTVCVVSGRDRAVGEELMGVDDLVVAGSHGFDIWSPNEGEIQHDAASAFSDVVEAAYRLRAELGSIPGVVVKPKRVSVAVRYRLVDQDQRDRRATTAGAVFAEPDRRKVMPGKMVYEHPTEDRLGQRRRPRDRRPGWGRRLRPVLPPEVEQPLSTLAR